MQTRPKAVFAKAAELTDAKSVRSLGKWMVRHHDDLLAHFAAEPLGRPDWLSFVMALAENGIVRRDGAPIASETARRTWNRVKISVAKARAPKVIKIEAPAPARLQPEAKPAPSTPSQSFSVIVTDDPDEETIELTFARPATHKKDNNDV